MERERLDLTPLDPTGDPAFMERMVARIMDAAQAVLDRALRCNLRTRIYQQFDSAGVEISARLDANDNVSNEPSEFYLEDDSGRVGAALRETRPDAALRFLFDESDRHRSRSSRYSTFRSAGSASIFIAAGASSVCRSLCSRS